MKGSGGVFKRNVLVAVAASVLAGGGVMALQGADNGAIAKVRTAYEKAAGAQDAAAVARLYTADGIEMPPNAPAVKGRAAIEAYHKGFAQQFMVHGLTVTGTEVHVSGDTAYDIGTYKQSLMPQKGGGMIDDKGKYIVLLKKDASGSWLITHAMYSSDNPPPGAPAPKK